MNKFLTFAGTQPVYLGDIDFMQNASAAMLTALARALVDSGNDNVNAILQGVNISRTSSEQAQYTSGIVVLNGEILPVAGGVIASDNDNFYFHVVYAMSGNRTFKDGVSRDCYETRSVIINTTSSGGINVRNVPRLFHRPDNFGCQGGAATGVIQSGRLYRRNGFWFVYLVLEFAPGEAPYSGEITFSEGITAEILGDISLIPSFPCLFNIGYSSTNGHALLSFQKGTNNLTLTITDFPTITVGGSSLVGYVSTMLIPN